MTTAATVWGLAIADIQPLFESIAATDGNLVTYQREALFAMQIFDKSDYLQKCSPQSIRSAVTNVASVGLTLNPAMKLAYLVPRKGVACLDISYIGLVKIATDSGGVLAVSAIPVRANDQFSYNGPFAMPDHKFNPFDNEAARGEIVGVYTAAKLASGILQVDTLSREEINKIRAVSMAKSGPWVEWFEEMVKKSGIKRASKMWPRTERMSAAEAILNEHEGMRPDVTYHQGVAVEAETMPDAEYQDFVKAIEAQTTKEAAKAEWQKAVIVCKDLKDVESANRLKAVLIEHGVFIDKAAAEAAS